jgi:hypothetical protein
MRRSSPLFFVLVALLPILVPRPARAQHAALPASLIALDTDEGQALLVAATARRDFFPLSASYVTQDDPGYCGVASAVMVLNALQVPAPTAPEWGASMYTQANFFNEKATSILAPRFKGGMTLQQLADMIQCHPATAQVVYASDTTLEAFRDLASKNLAEPGNHVIVNYNRQEVDQEFMGHISPLGAYDGKTDRFLIMDVARYKYPPVWVDAAALFRAMNTSDIVSGKSRGFVVVTAAAAAPGPSGAKPPSSPIRMLIGILACVFVLGVIVGAVVQTIRLKRRFRRASVEKEVAAPS